MTKLKATQIQRYDGKLTYATVQAGQYGQEVVFNWEVTGHPRIKTFVEKFKIGSDLYGDKAFLKLQRAIKAMTGREIDKESDLEEDTLLNLEAWLAFDAYNGIDYISGRGPRTEGAAESGSDELNEELNDIIPF